MPRIKSIEGNIEFVVDAKEVAPTEEEKNRSWGRDRYTAEQFCAAYGWTHKWFETTAVVEIPTALDVESDDFPAPVWDLVVPEICEVGKRYPVMFHEDHAWCDMGDASCDLKVEETDMPKQVPATPDKLIKKVAIMDPETGEMFKLTVGSYDHDLGLMVDEDGVERKFVRKEMLKGKTTDAEVNVFQDDGGNEFYAIGAVS